MTLRYNRNWKTQKRTNNKYEVLRNRQNIAPLTYMLISSVNSTKDLGVVITSSEQRVIFSIRSDS